MVWSEWHIPIAWVPPKQHQLFHALITRQKEQEVHVPMDLAVLETHNAQIGKRFNKVPFYLNHLQVQLLQHWQIHFGQPKKLMLRNPSFNTRKLGKSICRSFNARHSSNRSTSNVSLVIPTLSSQLKSTNTISFSSPVSKLANTSISG